MTPGQVEVEGGEGGASRLTRAGQVDMGKKQDGSTVRWRINRAIMVEDRMTGSDRALLIEWAANRETVSLMHCSPCSPHWQTYWIHP